MRFDNDVTSSLGISVPILSAPMGWVARPALVAAVSEAGGMGLVPGSLSLEQVRDDIDRTRELTDRPIGVNIPIAFAKDPRVVEMIMEKGIRFATTSAGSPRTYTSMLKEAGLVVYHVVPTLEAAMKAIDAGVDGLVVEGSEGAGFKSPHEVSTMVLLPLIAQHVSVPIIAAGGIADGASLLAAFALGAQGAQMGTRMLSSAEADVHDNVKNAVLSASETSTTMLNRSGRRPMRVLETATTIELDSAEEVNPLPALGRILEAYHGGDINASLMQMGQVAGRIDEILPAGEILSRTLKEFEQILGQLQAINPSGSPA